MLQSMTGYGKAIFENENQKIEIEIKSLNSKTLDLKIKYPNITGEQEMFIRNIISEKLNHGKIDCNINVICKNNKGKFKINENVFDKYYNQINKVLEKYDEFSDKNSIYQSLLLLPEIIESEEQETEDSWIQTEKTFNIAMEKIIKFRKQEGEAIAKSLLISLEKISFFLTEVPDYELERTDGLKQKLRKLFEENQLLIDSDRLESEMIYYIEKFDISEEKSRLANHLKYFKETMKEEFCGKKLSFISQEMGREINTLGSKANHFEIQRLVVLMKDELEKIKEQVLNIL